MAFRYPGGKKYNGSRSHQTSSPSNLFGNRGMTLEQDLNDTNQYYRSTGKAVIHKKPTPVQIVHVDYPKRSAAKITEAYFKQPSTTDYNGIYRGSYIDFEAKETRNKTSFPFGNIHAHQMEHMHDILRHDGIAFLIIRFTLLEQTYLYDASLFLDWYFGQKERKSIPLQDIRENGHYIPLQYSPRINYLDIVDLIYFS
ncbi:Holliday junction resolvase RecU [Salibacterium halotolerans]|uniref:Holliday junction resolvase RecU n=1 Tax=Salibacterium halotolerans TaxID=1884432 RepID=A0A1I5QAU0_9BACI|nr:Holliday junction resolvase RecU [Salibacterium halotolerans]SFP42956.1 recombination protein U [Salibacterium halotolerans]